MQFIRFIVLVGLQLLVVYLCVSQCVPSLCVRGYVAILLGA